MLKEKLDEFKALVTKKTEGNNKRKIENLVIFLIILIITIIAINVIWNDTKTDSNNEEATLGKQLALLDTSDTDSNHTSNTSSSRGG